MTRIGGTCRETISRSRAWRPPAAHGRLVRRLRGDDGAAVAEFPMVAVLIVMIGLLVVQAALIVHTRNTLVERRSGRPPCRARGLDAPGRC